MHAVIKLERFFLPFDDVMSSWCNNGRQLDQMSRRGHKHDDELMRDGATNSNDQRVQKPIKIERCLFWILNLCSHTKAAAFIGSAFEILSVEGVASFGKILICEKALQVMLSIFLGHPCCYSPDATKLVKIQTISWMPIKRPSHERHTNSFERSKCCFLGEK